MGSAQEIRVEAIILKVVPYGEADAVVWALSREEGRLSLFAKGARSSRRPRFGASLQPFTRVNLGFRDRPGAGLASLCCMDVAHLHQGIRDSLSSIAAASYAVEVCIHTAPERAEATALYLILERFLCRLDRMGRCGWGDVVAFELAALGGLGFLPELWRCSCCGDPKPEDTAADKRVHLAGEGGVICAECCHHRQSYIDGIRLSASSLEALRRLASEPYCLLSEEACDEVGGELGQRARRATRFLLDRVVGCKLRTVAFLCEALEEPHG